MKDYDTTGETSYWRNKKKSKYSNKEYWTIQNKNQEYRKEKTKYQELKV